MFVLVPSFKQTAPTCKFVSLISSTAYFTISRQALFYTYTRRSIIHFPCTKWYSSRRFVSLPRRTEFEQYLSPSNAQRATIFALASPPGRGGIAIIRISGPLATEVYRKMTRRPKNEYHKLPLSRKMSHCIIIDPVSLDVLDDALVVFFKSPNSFTTEDVVELHIHSGRAVISGVLDALSKLPGFRMAEAGEFTRRAYIGGRLDLTQVEGISDLIEAETSEQRHLALNAVRGNVRNKFKEIRQNIVQCIATIEALIDFSEGGDNENNIYDDIRSQVISLHKNISLHLEDDRRGEIIRSGVKLTIFGPPNAGKSTLFNFLAQRDVAIVTAIPGTTRDVLELTLDIGGIAVVIADTAGLRETTNIVEQIGMVRAQERIKTSDVSVCVISLPEIMSHISAGAIPDSVLSLIKTATFVVLNKSDQCTFSEAYIVAEIIGKWTKCWTISLSSKSGTKRLLTEMEDGLRERYLISESMAAPPLITNVRHRRHLEGAQKFLEGFLRTEKSDVVLGAEELRYAAEAIGRVTGAIGADEILDEIFSKFCIGK